MPPFVLWPMVAIVFGVSFSEFYSRKAGISERAMRRLIQMAFYNNHTNAVLLSALRGIL